MNKLRCAEFVFHESFESLFYFVNECMIRCGVSPMNINSVVTAKGQWIQAWYLCDDDTQKTIQEHYEMRPANINHLPFMFPELKIEVETVEEETEPVEAEVAETDVAAEENEENIEKFPPIRMIKNDNKENEGDKQ